MKFVKIFLLLVVCFSLDAAANESQASTTPDYSVECVGEIYFKGKSFQANRLIFKSNQLSLKMKFDLMKELFKLCDRFIKKDCLVFITEINSGNLTDIEYCVSYFAPPRGLSPKMYFYEKTKEVGGYGFGRPIGGVHAEGEDGDFYYKDLLEIKTEYPKNNQGVTPTYKFPNFESYCEEHGSPGAFKNCKIEFIMYNDLKRWANQCWKPSQIRLYNSAIMACRALMYQSYLKMEDLGNTPHRLSKILEDCKPKMMLLLFNLKDKEVSDFVLAEFEFLEWDLSKIESDIWSMKTPR